MKKRGLEDWSNFIRSLVRPVVTLGLVGAVTALVWMGRTDQAGFSELATLTAALVAFWFGARGLSLRQETPTKDAPEEEKKGEGAARSGGRDWMPQ